MRFIADFHIHSKYSRATSKDMEVETLARWAKKKGISLLGTGDFTHPTYFAELRSKLVPAGNGLYELKNGEKDVRFILTTELCNIYTQDGKGRRIHNLIFVPSLEVADKIRSKLGNLGKLSSDGRPIFSFTARELVKMIMDISGECLVIPAHVWTPWFSVFGANSGFDSIEECFGELSPHTHAIETGLSSDLEMNWRLSRLDSVTPSNSDAHSPNRLGRRPMPLIVHSITGRSSKRFEKRTGRRSSTRWNSSQKRGNITTMVTETVASSSLRLRRRATITFVPSARRS
jgi:PHP family Zn ribbon phosphoesterase